MPTSLWAVMRRCDARFAHYSVACASYKSRRLDQRRSKAIFAKDCLSDGLFAFTLAAPFPKKFYNFLGSPFLSLLVGTQKDLLNRKSFFVYLPLCSSACIII